MPLGDEVALQYGAGECKEESVAEGLGLPQCQEVTVKVDEHWIRRAEALVVAAIVGLLLSAWTMARMTN